MSFFIAVYGFSFQIWVTLSAAISAKPLTRGLLIETCNLVFEFVLFKRHTYANTII